MDIETTWVGYISEEGGLKQFLNDRYPTLKYLWLEYLYWRKTDA